MMTHRDSGLTWFDAARLATARGCSLEEAHAFIARHAKRSPDSVRRTSRGLELQAPADFFGLRTLSGGRFDLPRGDRSRD